MGNLCDIVPLNQLSRMATGIYVVAICFGCLGSLLVAFMVKYVFGRFTSKKWKIRIAFWFTFAFLFVWIIWAILVPSVNFRTVSVSPDGNRRLLLEDITGWTYEEIGWRLKARLMDAQTNRCLKKMIIRFWHSGFDDVSQPPPKPGDVRIKWSKDNCSVMIEYGWVCGILPEGNQIDSYSYAPEIVERFLIPANNDKK